MKFSRSALWSLIILIMSLLPGRSIPKVGWALFSNLDKLVHAGIYAVLAWLLGFETYRHYGELTWKHILLIVAGAAVFGICIEGIQEFFLSDRFFEIPDIIANIIGSLIGALLVYIFNGKKKYL